SRSSARPATSRTGSPSARRAPPRAPPAPSPATAAASRPTSSRTAAASAPRRVGELAMATAMQGTASNYLQRAPSPSGLADVLDLILDKGLVIDAYVRVAVIGIELITIDARVVIASIDTYLRFAEAVNRLDLTQTEAAGLPELREKGAEKETEGAIEGVKDELEPDET